MPAIVGITRLIKTGAKVADAAQAAEVAVKTTETAAEVAPAVSPNRVPMSKLLPAKEPGPLADKFQGEGYHYSFSPDSFKQFDTTRSYPTIWDSLGVHVGTKKASKDRAMDLHSSRITPQGHTLELRFDNSKPLLNPEGYPWGETSFKRFLAQKSKTPAVQEIANRIFLKTEEGKLYAARRKEIEQEAAKVDPAKVSFPSVKESAEAQSKHMSLMNKLSDLDRGVLSIKERALGKAMEEVLYSEGYTHIPYFNSVEDIDSVSNIVLRPKQNLRHKNAAFHLEYTSLMGTIVPMAIGGAAAAGGKDEAR